MKYLNDDAPCRDLIWNTMKDDSNYSLYSLSKMDCAYKYMLSTQVGETMQGWYYNHIGQVLAHIKNGGPVE